MTVLLPVANILCSMIRRRYNMVVRIMKQGISEYLVWNGCMEFRSDTTLSSYQRCLCSCFIYSVYIARCVYAARAYDMLA